MSPYPPTPEPPLDPETPSLGDFGTGAGVDVFQGGGAELARITATDYQWYPGLIVGVIGAAESDTTVPSVAVMRAHKTVCFKVLRWVVARLGTKPVLPSFHTGSANEVLIYKQVGGSLPGVLGDGQPCWSMNGLYVYVLVQPPQEGDSLTLGGSWVRPDLTASINTIIPSDFSTSLSGPAPAVTNLVPGWASFVSS
jgi:hypothetical protein